MSSNEGAAHETPPSADTDTRTGALTVTIHDRSIEIVTSDGGGHVIPVGPVSLNEREFGHLDPPPASCLTNALGLVQDHLDDVLVASPGIAGAPSLVFAGHHAASLARVEVGAEAAPQGYRVQRGDIDEVFRTVVAEPAAQRRANPGLDDDHVDTIIATCCVTLAIMRRLSINEATIVDDHAPTTAPTTGPTTGPTGDQRVVS